MLDDSSRRGFLVAAGATVIGIGCGVPFVRALARESASGDGEKATGPRWALVVDTKACDEQGECTKCSDRCHAVHNVPHYEDTEEQIKWIWKEHYGHVFHGLDHEYIPEDVGHRAFPVLCNHCDDPPCVRVCPTQATWKRDDGIVMMDMHRCIGCRYCMVGCPYGSRSFNFSDPRIQLEKDGDIQPNFPSRSKGVVEKCNFCAEKARTDPKPDGSWDPECALACEAGAILWGNIHDSESEVRKALSQRFAIRRKAELGTKPHVFYLL